MKRRYAIGAVAAAVLALGLWAAGASPASRPVVYGASIVDHITGAWTFQRLDARTLRPIGRGRHAGAPEDAWSFSPDRTKLALGPQILNLPSLRELRLVHVPSLDVSSAAWVAPKRLMVLGTGPDTVDSGPGPFGVATVDPSTGRVLTRASLDVSLQAGIVVHVSRTPRGIAFLLVSFQDVRPTILVLAGVDGSVREVSLTGVPSGYSQASPRRSYCCFSLPALAVDETGSRAFVTAAGTPVAEVDLKTLAVTYHGLGLSAGPAARATVGGGAIRSAVYLPSGLLAISGSFAPGGGTLGETSPAGLVLVDTRTWNVRRLAPKTTAVAGAGRGVLAFGTYGSASRPLGTGVTVYTDGGTVRFHRLGRSAVGTAWVTGRYAYLDDTARDRRSILDLSTGRILRSGSFGPTVIFADQHAGTAFIP
jgi:hypothetical protein